MILEVALECIVSTTTKTIQRLRMHNYKYKIIFLAIFKNDVILFVLFIIHFVLFIMQVELDTIFLMEAILVQEGNVMQKVKIFVAP